MHLLNINGGSYKHYRRIMYFIRCVKIVKTEHNDLDNLYICYTGDEYQPLNLGMGTYCGLTKYEWIQSPPAGGLYKYTEKYVETDNVMHVDDKKQMHTMIDEPDFLSFHRRNDNVISHRKLNGEELVIGLYKKDAITQKYVFMRNSAYDKTKQMFILF